MKVAFDHQIFTMQKYGGISRYFVRLGEYLNSFKISTKIIAPLHLNNYLNVMAHDFMFGVRLNFFPPRTTWLFNALNRKISSLFIQSYQPDILHETYYTDKPLSNFSKARILTVYDMIHEKFRSEFSEKDRTSQLKRLAVSRADHIICISESTKRDLCEIFEVNSEKVTVVHLGFDILRNKFVNNLSLEFYRPYLLYVGSRSGYKNFKALLDAISSETYLSKTFDIVAFGGGPLTSEEQQYIHDLGFLPNQVRYYSGDDAMLSAFYSNAAAFIYPSLYEGFGLPPLEAMAHECPVVLSNTSSMPEIVGTAGEYFNPKSVDEIASAITKVVFDENRRTELVSLGKNRLGNFSWEKCARETIEVYKKILNQ